ncbi:hypothetical protein M514_25509 [Trichuris suis]|uniref:Uncharacterized protein n=1 Tax=Trichuris suis TaxID=68888 RepID=A0A085MYH8_9BILA|nr:hypothetical protein M514_25509 [Trichuris suis]
MTMESGYSYAKKDADSNAERLFSKEEALRSNIQSRTYFTMELFALARKHY